MNSNPGQTVQQKPELDFSKPWKVAFEEHFLTPSFCDLPSGITAISAPKVYQGLLEVGSGRIDLMDQAKIEYAILSLNSPGLQAEASGPISADKAIRSNNELKQIVDAHPKRLGGFAALPTQDPYASADELERAVETLGFHGALINSFSNIGDSETVKYLDDPSYDVLWERAQALRAPIYLHPRNPLASQQVMFAGHPELLAATWAFLVECSTHALRMITSGVFDRYPGLIICLGHLGEALPAYQWRISKTYSQKVPQSTLKKDIYGYLKSNFVFTTSGFFDTRAMMNVAETVGVDRVCFSSDHPWMSMLDGGDWFDRAQISDEERLRIGRTNAVELFGLEL
ncbi:amidohydrolase family protein [Caballeronia sp. SEWSISQ10-4 2]|uniref:amidohydrolase family protein n=1 Tax=Caballeronia sp. SEWSISQ10-4 2 TaxID=2937438 RepID=UPI002652C51F|nr:amidohydrolase family protein [Caballeronia sp. SEWSISQ10-4 2]MDN7179150.1 amidohydrolase family protein [Caballeronia sp. SEWSISQ10-4 2]